MFLHGYNQEITEGQIRIIQDPLVDSLASQYADYRADFRGNSDNKGISGYRVQIFFDSGNYSGQRTNEAKKEFKKKYQSIPAYISWKAPNYRLRVGDFRTRLDAERFLQKIKRKYPNAWVIKCKINFPEI